MTAARKSEAADIAVGEIDFQAGRWSIPKARTKNGHGIVLPLHHLVLPDLRTLCPGHRPSAMAALSGDVAGNGFKGSAS